MKLSFPDRSRQTDRDLYTWAEKCSICFLASFLVCLRRTIWTLLATNCRRIRINTTTVVQYIYVCNKASGSDPLGWEIIQAPCQFSRNQSIYWQIKWAYKMWRKQSVFWRKNTTYGYIGIIMNYTSGRSGLSTWKYHFSYDHWSQAMLSSVSSWMGHCSSVARGLLLTLKAVGSVLMQSYQLASVGWGVHGTFGVNNPWHHLRTKS